MLETYFQEMLNPKDPWLHIRKKYWDRFLESGFLEGNKQAFQYVPLERIRWPELAKQTDAKIPPFDGFRIVFVDGFVSLEKSVLPQGVVFLPLDTAMKSFGIFLQNRMNRLLKEEKDPIAFLNGALQGLGAFLYVPPGMHIKEPIHICHFGEARALSTARFIASIGNNASLKLVDHSRFHESVCNFYTDVALDVGSECEYQSYWQSNVKAVAFQSFRASLKRRARLEYRYYSEGSEIVRNSIHVQLMDEESEAILKGLTLLDGQNRSHVHALVEHMAPHTRSRQHFKALVKGSSLSSFEGKIYVHPIAQKTEAYQLSNNLILSDAAAVYAKPNLEIFADDVKASHGATISQLNEEELFYLRSRGLSKEDAHMYLMEGFVNELRECMPKEGL